jgi:hypothetical protein
MEKINLKERVEVTLKSGKKVKTHPKNVEYLRNNGLLLESKKVKE